MDVEVFSFFSGLGFLDLGFENAGFNIVFVNMREEMAGTLRLMDIAKKMLENICRMSFGKKHSLIMTIERRS